MDIMHLLFSFQGRIRRLHFWLAAICSGVGIGVIASVMLPFSGILSGRPNPMFGLVMVVLYVAMVWIGLALDVKRCHDRDKSGWFVLIALIPLIGGLWLLIELGFLDGTQGPNRFGPSPKGTAGPESVAA